MAAVPGSHAPGNRGLPLKDADPPSPDFHLVFLSPVDHTLLTGTPGNASVSAWVSLRQRQRGERGGVEIREVK